MRSSKIEAGDMVRLDPSKANIFQALNNDGSTGKVKRVSKDGQRALVEWRAGIFSPTSTNILEKVKAKQKTTPRA
jgi:hypothetical protein